MRDNPEKCIDEHDYFAHIYAAYLLAQFRVNEAYPVFADILSLPNDMPYDLFGDTVLEAGSRILASICGSNTNLIKALIENTKADEYMRGQAIEALAILTIHDVIQRDEVVLYYKKLLGEATIIDNPLLLALLVCACCDIYPEELYEDIKICYEKGLVDETVIGIKSVDAAMIMGIDYTLDNSKSSIHLQFINDTIAELEHWACYDKDVECRCGIKAMQNSNSAETVIKGPKVGRNDPCPCGSGKKYKKCCGK